MKSIIEEIQENLGMCVFLVASYVGILCLLIPMVLGCVGLGPYVILCGALVLGEALIFTLSNKEFATTFVWYGLIFHLLGFLVFYVETSLCGWWGEPFEWEAELGHGNFSSEVSPAICWTYLVYIAAARVILQPLYLLIIKMKHRR